MPKLLPSIFAAALLASVGLSAPALACGDSEAPVSCDAENAGTARWMLNRVVAAVQKDEPAALSAFSKGQNGFRTADIYVFCVNVSDGVMSSHPDPKLMGKDALGLVDPNGKHFIVEMLDVARPDKVAEVNYLFPRPGSDIPVPKKTYVMKVADQVCGVGYYDLARPTEADGAPPVPKLDRLQAQLDKDMPPKLQMVWRDYRKALDDERASRKAVNGRLLEQVKQIETVLGKDALAAQN